MTVPGRQVARLANNHETKSQTFWNPGISNNSWIPASAVMTARREQLYCVELLTPGHSTASNQKMVSSVVLLACYRGHCPFFLLVPFVPVRRGQTLRSEANGPLPLSTLWTMVRPASSAVNRELRAVDEIRLCDRTVGWLHCSGLTPRQAAYSINSLVTMIAGSLSTCGSFASSLSSAIVTVCQCQIAAGQPRGQATSRSLRRRKKLC